MFVNDNHKFIKFLQGCRVLSWLSELGCPALWSRIMKHSKWESVTITELKDILNIPRLPACYVIYLRKNDYAQYQLIYIGCSTRCARARIKSRIKSKGRQNINHRMFCPVKQAETLYFDHKNARVCKFNKDDCIFKVKYKLSTKLGEELMREYRLIKRLNPICNRQIRKIKAKEIPAYPWYCMK